MNAAILTNLTISVEHLSPDSSNSNQEGYVFDLSLSAVRANIQPSSPEVVALYGGAYGKAFTMFTTTSGILETDRITVSGTNTQYIVKGVQLFDYGLGQHAEHLIEKVL